MPRQSGSRLDSLRLQIAVARGRLSAVWEVNYLLVLVGLACLWAPEAGAKEYAYVMELSTIGNDLEFDTNIVDSPDSDDEGMGSDNDMDAAASLLLGEICTLSEANVKLLIPLDNTETYLVIPFRSAAKQGKNLYRRF